MFRRFPLTLLILLIPALTFATRSTAGPDANPLAQLPKKFIGMRQKEFSRFYPKTSARTYRNHTDETWLTFDYPLRSKTKSAVTFHLKNGKVLDWKFDDRPEIVREYMGEFASQTFIHSFPVIGEAIRDVLLRMPYDDFLNVTTRRRPILFTEVFDSGTAQFANSSEIVSLPDDPPAFQDGMTLIKLSTGLESAPDPKAAEGIIAHEIAHRVLEHVKKNFRSCAAERQANALIKSWGFDKEYEQAAFRFGHHAIGETNPCKDE